MTDSQQYLYYLPIYDPLPTEWQEAQNALVERFTRYAEAINAKEIGWYYDTEVDTGKKFIPVSNSATSNNWRTIFRMVVDTGGLPNTTTKSVSHGITVDDNFTLIKLWGSATKPTSSYSALPLPYASSTLNDNISINMDATNINIITAKDYTAYTKSYVIAEYIQEV